MSVVGGLQPIVVRVDDPRTPDVSDLLRVHLDFARATTPPEDVHALDIEALVHPAITFVAARDPQHVLLGVGALKLLDAGHAELKSMHTAAAARGRGVGRAVVAHLLVMAAERGIRRVSLETGSGAAFAPARALYAALGFVECGPFADYPDSPRSTYMTMTLPNRI